MFVTEEELLCARFAELAEGCYTHGRYTYTDFLSLSEQDVFHRAAPAFSYVPYTLFGGAEGCERVMVRFGDEDTLGYPPPPFPISCLSLQLPDAKFAEPLSHRDFLGALLNLGIKRECTGDIFLSDSGIYLFVSEKIAPFLCENLVRVRHTALKTVPAATPPAAVFSRTEERTVTVASLRADGVIAHALSLSRADAESLFAARRVFVDGRVREDGAKPLSAGELVSVRGYGRFRVLSENGKTRKGRISLSLAFYV